MWGSPWTAIYGKPGKAFQVKMKSLKVSVVFFKKICDNFLKLKIPDCKRGTWSEMGENTPRH